MLSWPLLRNKCGEKYAGGSNGNRCQLLQASMVVVASAFPGHAEAIEAEDAEPVSLHASSTSLAVWQLLLPRDGLVRFERIPSEVVMTSSRQENASR